MLVLQQAIYYIIKSAIIASLGKQV